MTRHRYILVADDDLEDRYMMLEGFKELGDADNLGFAEDGILLLETLYNLRPDAVGLVVLDLNMPRLGGTETLRAIKSDEHYKHIPVIIFSTSVNDIERSMCIELGARAYVTKPTKWNEYIAICKMLCEIAVETTA